MDKRRGPCKEARHLSIGNAGYLYLAHRFVYATLHKDKDINNLVIRHRCDNTRCVNAKHLVSGTKQDNSRDSVKRNRQAKGERNGHAKLTNKRANFIRYLHNKYGVSRRELADGFDVSVGAIRRILKNLSYK